MENFIPSGSRNFKNVTSVFLRHMCGRSLVCVLCILYTRDNYGNESFLKVFHKSLESLMNHMRFEKMEITYYTNPLEFD
jgi:hypothetical protein